MKWLPLAATCLALSFASVPMEARADFTAQGSIGTSLVVGGSKDRGPITFEIGPGYQLTIVRLELPVVLSAAANGAFPNKDGFLGLRPSIKVFPIETIYLKASTQIFFAEESIVGLGLGGGLEYKLADMFAIFGEITFNPYVKNGDGTPIELRAGATFIF